MTTPDKEEMPTEDRTAGDFWAEKRDGRWQLQMRHRGPGSSFCVAQINHWADNSEALTTRIANACNAYEPTREALTELLNVPELADIDPEDRSEECWEAERKARAALSTLPVNDRHHSGSDNERNFENVRDAWKIIWEREAEIARLSRSLSELEAHHVEQNRLKRRSEADSKTLRIIRAALYGTDRQTSDDVGRLRALLVALDALIEQCRPLIAVDAFVLRDAIYEAHQARAALKGVPHPASDDYQADAGAPALSEKFNDPAAQEVCGHKTFYSPERGYWHEPLTKSEADELLASAERARIARERSMPDTNSAIRVLFEAQQRLKELGWREAQYCPKDGSHFEVIEPGSTGIFRGSYVGEWPTGGWWIDDEDGGCTSTPILFRLYPEDEIKRQEKVREAFRCYSEAELNFSNDAERDGVSLKSDTSSQPASEAGKLSTDEVK